MKPALTIIALVLALAAAGGAGYSYFALSTELDARTSAMDKLKTRLATAERKVEELAGKEEAASRTESSAPQDAVKKMVALEERVNEVTSEVESLDTQVSALQQSDKENKTRIANLDAKTQKPLTDTTSGAVVRREDVEKLIEEKLKDRQPEHRQPPEIAAVGEQLGLDEMETKALEGVLRQKKTEHMELLRTPRPDGSNLFEEFADELVQAMASGQPHDQATRPVFMKFHQRINTEKVPGTETTYAEVLQKKQQETREAFKSTLSEEQFNKLQTFGIPNPMDIRIPDEPMGVYIQQRMQAAGVTPGQPQPQER